MEIWSCFERDSQRTYKYGMFESILPDRFVKDCSAILDRVFKDYAVKDSWSLSRLTHGELSWKNSRIGISDEDNSNNPMSIDDIKKDAERIKARRKMLIELGLV